MQVATASYAFDKKSARSFDADGRMRVRDCVISVAEINPYYGKEIPRATDLGLSPTAVYDLYRDPDELARAADSFNGLPLMIRHVAQTADEPRKEYIGGSVYNARFEDGKLRADLLLMDKQAIEYVESGELADLSSSYRYRADMSPVEIDGRTAHGVMRDIEGNHVALVEDGRATGAHVADSALSSQPGATTVSDTESREDKILHMLEAIDNRLTAVETTRANDEATESEKADSDEDDKAEDEATAKSEKDEDEKDEKEAKVAMDAASVQAVVDAAVAAERKRAEGVEAAKRATRAVLGDVIAMDSAGDIYREALKRSGADVSAIAAGTEQLAWTAFQSVTSARPVHAMDSRSDDKKSPFNTSHIKVR